MSRGGEDDGVAGGKADEEDDENENPIRRGYWTAHFDHDTKRIPSEDVWESSLLPELRGVRSALRGAEGGCRIDVRGRLPLSVALAVGATLSSGGRYRLRYEQGESSLWDTAASPSSMTLRVRDERALTGSSDLLAMISIAADASRDARVLVDGLGGDLRAIVNLSPEGGPSETAVRSENDAAALAMSAKGILREFWGKYETERIHLVVFAPVGFCLFLGHRLNAMGDIVVYERAPKGGYQRAVRLRTG